MKKSLILRLFILFVVLVVSAVSHKIYVKYANRKTYVTISIPEFQFVSSVGSLSNRGDVKYNVPVLFLYVSPNCETCISLLDEISKINSKSSLDIWIIVDNKLNAERIKESYPNLKNYVYSEQKGGDFHAYFGSSSLSSVYIYDSRHKLKKHYTGSISPIIFL